VCGPGYHPEKSTETVVEKKREGSKETMASYLALARKYRPQRFEDIVGQEHVCKTLQKAIGAGRVHHAYLFAGIRGIGKTTCARILAKALNCKKGPTPKPCNKCVSCKEIVSGRSMDVMEIDAASNRGIDDIRELREGVRYTTARDRHKIVIIDEVHMLTEAAFNALLKTLEEPPPHVRFILATTDPQKIPATILSRCQRFDFRRVTAASLVKHLKSICEQEEVEVEEDALAVIVRQTQGSVRDSLSLLDQLIAASEGNLTSDWAKEVLGVADRRWVLDTLSALVEGDAKRSLLVLREVFSSGYDINLFMTEVLQSLRNAMVLSIVGKNRELVDLTDTELAQLQGIVKGSNAYDLHYCLRVMLEALEQIRKSEFPLFAAEEALVRVASAGHTVELPSLVARLVKLERQVTGALNEPELFARGSSGAGSSAIQEEEPDPPADPPGPPGGRILPGVKLNEPAAAARRTEAPLTTVQASPEPAADAADGMALQGVTEEAAVLSQDAPQEAVPPAESAPEETVVLSEDAPQEAVVPGEVAPEAESRESRDGKKKTGRGPPLSPEELAELQKSPGRLWVRFVRFIREREEGRVAEVDAKVFEDCVLAEISGRAVTITVPLGGRAALHAYDVEELLTEFLGRKVSVTLEGSDQELLGTSIAMDRRRKRDKRRREVEDELLNHPHTRRAGRLLWGEPKVIEVFEQDEDEDEDEEEDQS